MTPHSPLHVLACRVCEDYRMRLNVALEFLSSATAELVFAVANGDAEFSKSLTEKLEVTRLRIEELRDAYADHLADDAKE